MTVLGAPHFKKNDLKKYWGGGSKGGQLTEKETIVFLAYIVYYSYPFSPTHSASFYIEIFQIFFVLILMKNNPLPAL